ncbi:MAG: diacylglycerol kinase [Nitrospirae bacterium]|nr:diacylglycerol kinase [Nitrospirota bacterium]
MPLRKFVESANFAIEGILHAAKTERHLRYHLYSAVLILLLSLILGVSRLEFVAIAISAIVVLSVEMLNTAIELIVDILFKDYDKKAKIIKDISAGAVLTAAIGSAVIGYTIFLPYLKNAFEHGLIIAHHSGEDIAVISLVVVLILVIITKSFFGRGTPLRGGLPSGHAAVAFSVWVAITFFTRSFMPSSLIFILAVLISQSRVSVGAHRPWEVVLGAFIGAAVTFFIFQLFLYH